MSLRLHAPAFALLLMACGSAPPSQATTPPLFVPHGPTGLRRCDAEPRDYPDRDSAPPPPRVDFASLPHDPTFASIGIALVAFRSGELVFHVSPDLAPAMVDCTVAAADDAVRFVNTALGMPSFPDGGPARDVFLLNPRSAPDVLERLDPGTRFGVGPETGAMFVGAPRSHPTERAIVHWKELPLSYLELGFFYAHEWVHVVQAYTRGRLPTEDDVIVEGEANYLATLFQDAVIPGAGSLFFERDARKLTRSRTEHPDLTLHDLLTQRPHQYHEEVSLFAAIIQPANAATLGRVRLLQRSAGADYANAWRRVAGRDLDEGGLAAVVASPSLTPRPALDTHGPALTIHRSADVSWFVATGFLPRERVTRSVYLPNGRIEKSAVEADNRGVVAWTKRLGGSPPYVARKVELRGDSGVCSETYFDGG